MVFLLVFKKIIKKMNKQTNDEEKNSYSTYIWKGLGVYKNSCKLTIKTQIT